MKMNHVPESPWKINFESRNNFGCTFIIFYFKSKINSKLK